MSATNPEIDANDGDTHSIVADVDAWIASLPASAGKHPAVAEGAEVSGIVESLGLPESVVAASRIAPLLREEVLTKDALENNKLQAISQLVLSIVQLSLFALPDDWRPGEVLAVKQSEALRKMLLASVSDIRLVLVRIAEQLYRMRASKKGLDETRRALALETREIYAPLASRLGVWQIKWELEDLAFRFLEPDTYASIATALNEKRGERERFIETVKTILKDELDREGIAANISGRPKHIYSIWRKMQRKDRGLEALYDIRAVRVLVDTVADCYAALGVVHNRWSYIPGEFDDYIANPKDNDYRSLHTAVAGPDGKTLEIQIRTPDMHRQAELGVAAHWRYKEGGGSPEAFDRKIRLLRQLLEPAGDGDLLEQIRDDMFEDRVYALSPKGDVVELPTNATPLDFAYHVHTQVGHRCRGAKINGRIVPLTQQIQNGDQVEIITGSRPKPSRDWLSPRLGYLAGSRARAKVRAWFRQQDRDQHLRQGREIVERELSRLGIRDVSIDDIAGKLKQKNADTLCVLIGAGELTAASIATAVQQLRGADVPRPRKPRRARRKTASATDDVGVSGIGDLMCNFARCCRPVPPESITGYITVGRGVTIHRADCGNVLSLSNRYPERIINVNWGASKSTAYPVDLVLHAFDRTGLIRDVTMVLADEEASILDLKSHTVRATAETTMQINIEVPDLPTLSTAMRRLEQLPNVISVKRST